MNMAANDSLDYISKCSDEMKRYYSDPNKTSVAMAPSGETKEIHSFRKYTLGKTKELLRTTEMEFLDTSQIHPG
jgi:hypothetical protein